MTKLIEIGGHWLRPDRVEGVEKLNTIGGYGISICMESGCQYRCGIEQDPVKARNVAKEYANIINEALEKSNA